MLVIAVPPAAAVFATVTNLFNLWLAARIVKISGRLRRPWPELAGLTLPTSSSGLLAAAIAGSFLPDLFGVLSGAFAASLLTAFAMLGFAVLHAITRGTNSRAVVLGACTPPPLSLAGRSWPSPFWGSRKPRSAFAIALRENAAPWFANLIKCSTDGGRVHGSDPT